jgi:quercetin dioxygenase-like cupin family protein
MSTATVSPTRPTISASGSVTAAGAGDAFWSFGDLVTFKVGPQHTGGAFSLAELSVGPGGGPPPHVHDREDETFYVLEGTMQFMLEDDVYLAGAGEAYFLPRGKVHTFTNQTDKPAKALVLASPCGFEQFMARWATPRSQSSVAPPVDDATIGKLMAACAEFGLQMRPDHKPKNAPVKRGAPHKPYTVIGLEVDMRLLTEDTRGGFSLVRLALEPGMFVPVHAHREMEEMFYVESGEFEFTLDGRPVRATKGTTIYIPRNVKHGFKHAGGPRGTLVNYHFPGGFEHFFRELNLIAPGMQFDPAAVGKLMDKHGMDVA